VPPAYPPGPQRYQVIAPVAEQPQADRRAVGCDLRDSGAVDGGQPHRHGVNPVVLRLGDVYVGYLRRKLGGPMIETVRGAGYRAFDLTH
jgi:hypothetical protein